MANNNITVEQILPPLSEEITPIPQDSATLYGTLYLYTESGDEIPGKLASLVDGSIVSISMTDLGDISTIKPYCFYGCASLESIELPDSITIIPDQCFYGCHKLKSVRFPTTLTQIGQSAFYYTSIESAILPDTLVSMGAYCFDNCQSLVKVVLPHGNSFTTLPANAFSACINLESIEIPSNITNLSNSSIFASCASLKNVKLPQTLSNTIGYGLFSGCTSLETITIPSGVTRLSERCFAGSGLKSIDLSSLTGLRIDTRCFMNCASLESVKLPENLNCQGQYVFVGCNALTSIDIPNGTYGMAMFSGLTGLTNVKFHSPSSLSSQMFINCSSLATVDFSEAQSIPSIQSNTFSSTPNTMRIIVPDALYESWKVATNWSAYANQIVKASEV